MSRGLLLLFPAVAPALSADPLAHKPALISSPAALPVPGAAAGPFPSAPHQRWGTSNGRLHLFIFFFF